MQHLLDITQKPGRAWTAGYADYAWFLRLKMVEPSVDGELSLWPTPVGLGAINQQRITIERILKAFYKGFPQRLLPSCTRQRIFSCHWTSLMAL